MTRAGDRDYPEGLSLPRGIVIDFCGMVLVSTFVCLNICYNDYAAHENENSDNHCLNRHPGRIR